MCLFTLTIKDPSRCESHELQLMPISQNKKQTALCLPVKTMYLFTLPTNWQLKSFGKFKNVIEQLNSAAYMQLKFIPSFTGHNKKCIQINTKDHFMRCHWFPAVNSRGEKTESWSKGESKKGFENKTGPSDHNKNNHELHTFKRLDNFYRVRSSWHTMGHKFQINKHIYFFTRYWNVSTIVYVPGASYLLVVWFFFNSLGLFFTFRKLIILVNKAPSHRVISDRSLYCF